MSYSTRHSRARLSLETHEQRLAVIDALDHAALVRLVASKAQEQDVVFLRTLLDDGAFDIPPNLGEIGHPSTRNGLQASEGIALINALSAIIFSTVFTDAEGFSSPALLRSSLEFKQLLGEIVDHVIDGINVVEKAPASTWSATTEKVGAFNTLNATASVLLATACALDEKAIVAKLAYLSEAWVPVNLLGKGFDILFDPNAKANAPMVAALFSAHGALDAIREAGVDTAPMVWFSTNMAPKINDSRLPNKASGELNTEIGMFSQVLKRNITLSDTMLVRVINESKVQGSFHPMDSEALYEMATKTLSHAGGNTNACVAAYLEAGVYDIHPAWSVEKALMQRRTNVVDGIQDMPWEELFPENDVNVLTRVMDAPQMLGFRQDAAPMLAKFMRDAEEAGYGDRLYNEKNAIVDVEIAIRKGHLSVLLSHLEHGLDPHAKLGQFSSPLDMAKQHNQMEALHMMHAHTARGVAHGLLDGMDLSPFMRAAP